MPTVGLLGVELDDEGSHLLRGVQPSAVGEDRHVVRRSRPRAAHHLREPLSVVNDLGHASSVVPGAGRWSLASGGDLLGATALQLTRPGLVRPGQSGGLSDGGDDLEFDGELGDVAVAEQRDLAADLAAAITAVVEEAEVLDPGEGSDQ